MGRARAGIFSGGVCLCASVPNGESSMENLCGPRSGPGASRVCGWRRMSPTALARRLCRKSPGTVGDQESPHSPCQEDVLPPATSFGGAVATFLWFKTGSSADRAYEPGRTSAPSCARLSIAGFLPRYCLKGQAGERVSRAFLGSF